MYILCGVYRESGLQIDLSSHLALTV